MAREFDTLTAAARACAACERLPLGPRPIFQINESARILIAGQAPGRRTHDKGIPFDDPSGERLRSWLGVSREAFYDPRKFAIIPMGLCYPGTAKGGDLPPRPECAPLWRARLLSHLPNIQLILTLGRYARDWHIAKAQGESLTMTARSWQSHWPAILPLPHPSPRNIRWFKDNPWFDAEVIPVLRQRTAELIRAKP